MNGPVVRNRRPEGGGASAGDRRHGPLMAHLPGLDGLRGLAVIGVIAYHLGITNDLPLVRDLTRGGPFGVSAFFTLSGYLIGSLLILEYERNGYISLDRFWSRRFRRLMPGALITIAAVVFLTPVVGAASQLREVPAQALAAVAYVFNWYQVAAGNDYAASFTEPSPLNHFWSLAVEEQTYVLLPLLAGVCMRYGRRRALAIAFGVIAVASCALMIVTSGGEYTNRAYVGTDTRVGEIAIGGLLACVAAGGAGPFIERVRRWLPLASGVATVALLGAWMFVSYESAVAYRGGFTLHAVLVAVIIAAVVAGEYPYAPVLTAAPVRWIGRVSYGLYLAHWPIMLWLDEERLGIGAGPTALVQLLSTAAIAAVSFHLIEQPIRTGRMVRGFQRVWVPIGAIAVIVVGVVLVPEPDSSDVLALDASDVPIIATTTAPPATGPAPESTVAGVSTTTTTAPPPPLRVIVTGDSFGLSLGVGFEIIARSGGPVSAYNRGMVGCGFGRGGRNRGIGKEGTWPEGCLRRDEIMREAAETFSPDIILISGGMWDITDRKLEGSNRWTHVGDPEYDAYLIEEIRALTDAWSQFGATVVWTTVPHFDPVYSPELFMGPPPYPEAEPWRAERFNELLREALSARPDAGLVDLGAWMQSYPGGEYAPDLRGDGVHFVESGAEAAARWILPQLEQYRPQR